MGLSPTIGISKSMSFASLVHLYCYGVFTEVALGAILTLDPLCLTQIRIKCLTLCPRSN